MKIKIARVDFKGRSGTDIPKHSLTFMSELDAKIFLKQNGYIRVEDLVWEHDMGILAKIRLIEPISMRDEGGLK